MVVVFVHGYVSMCCVAHVCVLVCCLMSCYLMCLCVEYLFDMYVVSCDVFERLCFFCF